MSFSKEPVVIYGGCNCRSIRYRITVPPFEERPANPYRTPDVDVGDARVPFVAIDHCNDCRRATSALMPIAIITTAVMTSISLMPKDTFAHTGPVASVSDGERNWVPISSVARDDVGDVVEGTTLGRYVSSHERNRWFCNRCGTPIGYSIWDGAVPLDWNWPKMFDIWLGTVDREYLEQEWMKPERMLWCHMAVPWIKDMITSGASDEQGNNIPRHPLTKIDKTEEDDATEDLEAMGSMMSPN